MDFLITKLNTDICKTYPELYELFLTIINSENNTIKFEAFRNFHSEVIKSDGSSYPHNVISLLLYALDIHKDFKNDLLTLIKSRRITYSKMIANFFSDLEFTKTTQSSKVKMKILNNVMELNTSILLGNSTVELDTFLPIYLHIAYHELNGHIKGINDEVYQLLIMYFKNFHIFLRSVDRKHLRPEHYELLWDIRKKFLSELQTHLNDLVSFNKDFEFTFSNSIFIINALNEDFNNYVSLFRKEIFDHFLIHPVHLLIYFKSFVVNCPGLFTKEDEVYMHSNFLQLLVGEKFDFSVLVSKFFIQDVRLTKISFANFYKLFLECDLKSNLTNFINEILLICLQRLSSGKDENLEAKVSKEFVSSFDVIRKIFNKMHRDKNNFNIMDDDYYLIIESLYKLNKGEHASLIEQCSNEYLLENIRTKSRIMIIEAKLFKFVKQAETRKYFFDFIFSKKFDKRNLPLYTEYIKIIFDFYFSQKENTVHSNIETKDKYNLFIDIFAESFLKYLLRVDNKDLKFFNNLFISMEKFNKNLFALVIREFHERFFLSPVGSVTGKCSILMTLLTPFKSQKKFLSITNDEILFCLNVVDYTEIKFTLSLKSLKTLAKSNDRYFIITLLEFISVFDEHDKIFPLIKTILKYNIKTSYVEFKSSVLKALKVYFTDYMTKLVKLMNKKRLNPNEAEYVNKGLVNLEYLLRFLSDNIYDRPVESLLVYLEIYNFILPCLEKSDDITNKEYNLRLNSILQTNLFERGLCFSLMSLLRHSWYFIRYNSMNILKHKNFKAILKEITPRLFEEIDTFSFSLRQMDAEGGVNLFTLLLHHFGHEFVSYGVTRLLNGELVLENEKVSETEIAHSPILKSINIFMILIQRKQGTYIDLISNQKDDSLGLVKSVSIHSYFIFIKSLLEIELSKQISFDELNVYTPYLLQLLENIININKQNAVHLVNNGVSEFHANEGDGIDLTYGGDNEDRRLISLWCATKYSIESLNLVLDVFLSNHKTLSQQKDHEVTLNKFEKFLNEIINLMISWKHMGAVRLLDEGLYKIALLLNKSEESFKDYREVVHNKLRSFIEYQLVQEEVSSILRRSAGIPFLMTSLVRSYISHDKFASFSHLKINEILRWCVHNLIDNYKKFQITNPDVSVHCLHILRVISDDTQVKSFAKEFYDYIIFKILDGLQSENWSIKNACMLSFSKIIKNHFLLNVKIESKNLPTFVEYFNEKPEFRRTIYEILNKAALGTSPGINDCCVLLVTFLSKFKKSKLAEINDTNLTDTIKVLLLLGGKNNKIFRKLLAGAVFKLYGDNFELVNEEIRSMINGEETLTNNLLDFLYNILKEYKAQDNSDENFIIEIIRQLQRKVNINDSTMTRNFFSLYKIAKLTNLTKSATTISPLDLFEHDFYLNFGFNVKTKQIDLTKLLCELELNSKLQFYFKYVKQIVLSENNFDIVNQPSDWVSFNKQSAQEIINLVLKKSPHCLLNAYTLEDYHREFAERKLLQTLNPNLTTKILGYLDENLSTLAMSKFHLDGLLEEFISTLESHRSETKLVNKLLRIVGNLHKLTQGQTQCKRIFHVIHNFSSSENEEKTRINAIHAFELMLKQESASSLKDHLFVILKTFNLILNDEHPEIRNLASRIFDHFNKLVHLYEEKDNFHKTAEFLLKKIFSIRNEEYSNQVKEFYDFIAKENLYFLKDKANLNNENKVFYYEPDNRYIDNIESKIRLIKYNTEYSYGLQEDDMPLTETVKILVMLETFAEFWRINFRKILHLMSNKKKIKFYFVEIRKYFYV